MSMVRFTSFLCLGDYIMSWVILLPMATALNNNVYSFNLCSMKMKLSVELVSTFILIIVNVSLQLTFSHLCFVAVWWVCNLWMDSYICTEHIVILTNQVTALRLLVPKCICKFMLTAPDHYKGKFWSKVRWSEWMDMHKGGYITETKVWNNGGSLPIFVVLHSSLWVNSKCSLQLTAIFVLWFFQQFPIPPLIKIQ